MIWSHFTVFQLTKMGRQSGSSDKYCLSKSTLTLKPQCYKRSECIAKVRCIPASGTGGRAVCYLRGELPGPIAWGSCASKSSWWLPSAPRWQCRCFLCAHNEILIWAFQQCIFPLIVILSLRPFWSLNLFSLPHCEKVPSKIMAILTLEVVYFKQAAVVVVRKGLHIPIRTIQLSGTHDKDIRPVNHAHK